MGSSRPAPQTLLRHLITPSKGSGFRVLKTLACCVPLFAWQLKLIFLLPPTLSLCFYLALVYRGSRHFDKTAIA